MRISDWSSDVCSSDLSAALGRGCRAQAAAAEGAEADRVRQLPPGITGARRRLPGQRTRLEAARGGCDGHVPAHGARRVDRDVLAVGRGYTPDARWIKSRRGRNPDLRSPTMPIEIERKFLVTNDSWRAAAHEVVPMAQGYINDQAAMDGGAQRASVRVRIAGAEAFLNIQSREAGHTRQEDRK